MNEFVKALGFFCTRIPSILGSETVDSEISIGSLNPRFSRSREKPKKATVLVQKHFFLLSKSGLPRLLGLSLTLTLTLALIILVAVKGVKLFIKFVYKF